MIFVLSIELNCKPCGLTVKEREQAAAASNPTASPDQFRCSHAGEHVVARPRTGRHAVAAFRTDHAAALG